MEQSDHGVRIEKLESRVDNLYSAFPGGDIDGHRRYHDEIIQELVAKRQMRSAIIEQVIKGSVWALLVAILTGAWTFVKDHLR